MGGCQACNAKGDELNEMRFDPVDKKEGELASGKEESANTKAAKAAKSKKSKSSDGRSRKHKKSADSCDGQPGFHESRPAAQEDDPQKVAVPQQQPQENQQRQPSQQDQQQLQFQQPQLQQPKQRKERPEKDLPKIVAKRDEPADTAIASADVSTAAVAVPPPLLRAEEEASAASAVLVEMQVQETLVAQATLEAQEIRAEGRQQSQELQQQLQVDTWSLRPSVGTWLHHTQWRTTTSAGVEWKQEVPCKESLVCASPSAVDDQQVDAAKSEGSTAADVELPESADEISEVETEKPEEFAACETASGDTSTYATSGADEYLHLHKGQTQNHWAKLPSVGTWASIGAKPMMLRQDSAGGLGNAVVEREEVSTL